MVVQAGEAEDTGRALALRTPEPFDGLWDSQLTYDRLPILSTSRLDEFRWLAENARDSLSTRQGKDAASEITGLLDAATRHGEAGRAEQEARTIINAYEAASRAWRDIPWGCY